MKEGRGGSLKRAISFLVIRQSQGQVKKKENPVSISLVCLFFIFRNIVETVCMHTEKSVSNQGKINTSLMSLEESLISTCSSASSQPPPQFLKNRSAESESTNRWTCMNDMTRFFYLQKTDKGSDDMKGEAKQTVLVWCSYQTGWWKITALPLCQRQICSSNFKLSAVMLVPDNCGSLFHQSS